MSSITIGQVRDVVVEVLEAVVLPRFDALEERMNRFELRMDGLEIRMDSLEHRMDGLERRIGGLENRIGGLEGRVTDIEVQMHAIRTRLDDIDGRLTAIEDDVKELYSMVAQVQKAQGADRKFMALSTDAKIRRLHSQITTLAEAEGIILPPDHSPAA